MPEKIKYKNIKWKKIRYLNKYNIVLNEPLASWNVFKDWEKERTESMQKHLKKTDVLYDIGAEMGWLSVVYARFVNTLVCIEPLNDFIGNIVALFLSNNQELPLIYNGFFGDFTNEYGLIKTMNEVKKYHYIIDKSEYPQLAQDSPCITLDKYVQITGIVPTALTIDVEGAEFKVIKGAEKTIKKYRPKIWVSEHDEMANKYGDKVDSVFKFLDSVGYKRNVLAVDHERHVYYEP